MAEGLRKEIGDRVLADLSFDRHRSSASSARTARGSPTLIKMLTGQEPVTASEVKVGGTVKLAFDQAREASAPRRPVRLRGHLWGKRRRSTWASAR